VGGPPRYLLSNLFSQTLPQRHLPYHKLRSRPGCRPTKIDSDKKGRCWPLTSASKETFSVPTDAHLVTYRLARMDSLDILRYSKEGRWVLRVVDDAQRARTIGSAR
jgi:hypothetical protein